MQVERQFIEVKQQQLVIELPASFINQHIEVIALTIDEEAVKPVKPKKHRRPHSAIAGKGKTLGDLVSPLVDQANWECLQCLC